MKQNYTKQLKKIFFTLLFTPFLMYSQVTVDFNSLGNSDNHEFGSSVDIAGFTFTINGGSGDDILYAHNDGAGNTNALYDDNLDIAGITTWTISKIDNTGFQLVSIYLQDAGFAVANGTIKAFKGGVQIGATVNINFDGVKTFSSNTDFQDIDEIRIEGADINFYLDDLTYIVDNTWNGSTNNDWHTSSNWSTNSTPVSSTKVTIPNGLTNYPTATSAIDVSTITIASGASMIAQSTVSGVVTYNLAIPDTNWHLVSSPVVGETYDDAWIAANAIASGSVTGTNRGIATYDNGTPDATTMHWRYFQAGATAANFNAGIGYSNKRTSAGNYSFMGTFPTTDVAPAISQNDQKDNLIGNPYPSYLDVAALITANTSNISSTHQAVYVWNGTTYTNLTTGYVHPGQAFFINSNVASGTATITEAMQSHQTGVTFYRTSYPRINLTFSNGTSSKETQINYLEDKTRGLDPRYDVATFTGVSSNLNVFTQLLEGYETVAFETQALPSTDMETMIVPVGVKASVNEEITFSVEAMQLPAGIMVFLEDRLTNTFTRLDEVNTEYSVTLTEDINGTGRFYIHTSRSALGLEDFTLSSVSVYKSNINTLRIVGLPQGNTLVSVFNIQGKEVLSTSFEATNVEEISLPKLSTGLYIVDVQTTRGKLSKKIILE